MYQVTPKIRLDYCLPHFVPILWIVSS